MRPLERSPVDVDGRLKHIIGTADSAAKIFCSPVEQNQYFFITVNGYV